MKKPSKWFKTILWGFIAALACLLLATTVWLGDYYKAEDGGLSLSDMQSLSVIVQDDYLAIYPSDATTGIILYQGAKVDYLAYASLARAFADRGFLCIVIDSPANIAITDVGKATTIIANYPQIDSWYVGGHSLGGVVASREILENAKYYDGLILLASYANVDLTNLDINVISVYGDQDIILNQESYDNALSNLPCINELVIEGGNHAQFGNYGWQSGDGEATITADEQQAITADFVLANIGG
ncbi:MAG: alpha/beta hydrolase [Saccharofermentans sp.]|nr:alpha/beta hydrolase [Saccharofermentans sp.]